MFPFKLSYMSIKLNNKLSIYMGFGLGWMCLSRVYLSNISNKRITRISSDTDIKPNEIKPNTNEMYLTTKLVNRNPRNLEQLSFQMKPLGYELDLPQTIFWNKVVCEKHGKYFTAKIMHYSGRVLVSASTKEVCIRDQLKNLNDVFAATIVGLILATRALESGVSQLFVSDYQNQDNSLKTKAFLKSLEENGLTLCEQPFIFTRKKFDL